MLDGPLRAGQSPLGNATPAVHAHYTSDRLQPRERGGAAGVSVDGTRRLRLCRDAVVAVMQAPTSGMATMRPADSGVTGRGLGVSLTSPRCVRERM